MKQIWTSSFQQYHWLQRKAFCSSHIHIYPCRINTSIPYIMSARGNVLGSNASYMKGHEISLILPFMSCCCFSYFSFCVMSNTIDDSHFFKGAFAVCVETLTISMVIGFPCSLLLPGASLIKRSINVLNGTSLARAVVYVHSFLWTSTNDLKISLEQLCLSWKFWW